MANAYRCPHCDSQVTPFAAGCAVCGRTLDPARHRSRPLGQRLRSLWAPRRGLRSP